MVNVMEYLAAAVVGLSFGVIYAYVAFPISRARPTICTSLVVTVTVWAVVWGPVANPALGVIIGLASIIGLALAGAQRWPDNPLFAGTSYGVRALTWMWRVRELREAERASASDPVQ